MTEYDFHSEASIDLDDIWEFIAEDYLAAADHVIDDIVAAIEALVSFPHQGHRRTDLISRPLRFWSVRAYLIAYAPNEKPLWIIAIIHGSRNPRVMAAILKVRNEPLRRSARESRQTLPLVLGHLPGGDFQAPPYHGR